MDRQPLYEKYRPIAWSEVVGQDKTLVKLDLMRRRAGTLAGRAYWISGASGTGKTTIARLIAADVASDWCIEELDASECLPAKLKDIERAAHTAGMGKGGRAYIINEAHGLRRDAIRQFLVLLERIPGHVVFVFTTTVDGQEKLFEDSIDAHPLLSRCVVLALARRDLSQVFAERCRLIAQAEGLDGQPVERYVRLLQDHRNNLRAAIQAIEAGEMMADATPAAAPAA